MTPDKQKRSHSLGYRGNKRRYACRRLSYRIHLEESNETSGEKRTSLPEGSQIAE